MPYRGKIAKIEIIKNISAIIGLIIICIIAIIIGM